MRQRIEASLQAAQTEARAAMDRHRPSIERIAAVLSERRELDAAQIADLLAVVTVEPVRTDATVPAGAE
jgi:ATP-dependent Zn protease